MRIRIPRKISPRQAVALQKKLAPLVKEESELPSTLEHLVGCDASYFHGITLAAATLVEYEKQKLLKVGSAKEQTRFPYVPGLLAFREAPAVLRAIRSIQPRSFVCMVDGHGLAHLRKFGLACFVGLALDRPTIGVAKSLLYGQVQGSKVVDDEGREIAEIIPLPSSRKSIYVSIGHKISLRDAVRIVNHTLISKGPIPISLAHEEVTKAKWLLKKSNQAF